ncbi:hypothetical protein D9613_003372 [Agrocybe pediades]|uniref:F-box domain-containing protein n=1 Tax=Agrocybe pediades TaxID=84607 RepID=A0A8H4QR69_9AGAR|nr:hypothetical protein D9613_003372 [Agrocybe pediades]
MPPANTRVTRSGKVVIAATTTVLAEDAGSSDSGEEERKSKRKQKRKNSVKETPVSRKKPRARKSITPDALPKLPPALCLEIFRHVKSPLDLLHLTWTCKKFHKVLHSCPSVWEDAQASIPCLPPRPDEYNEAQYAKIMFWRGCHATKFVLSGPFGNGYARDVSNMALPAKGDHFLRTSCGTFPRLCPAIPQTLEYDKAKDKNAWIENLVRSRKAFIDSKPVFETWLKNLEKLEEQNIFEEIPATPPKKKEKVVLEHLRKMGWTFRLSNIHYVLQVEEKARRLQAEQDLKDTFVDRLYALNDSLQAYALSLPINTPCPSVANLFEYPALQDVIKSPLGATKEEEREVLNSIQSMLPDLAAQWKLDMQDRLIHMIDPRFIFDKERVLHLATTAFTCSSDKCYRGDRFLTYPRILVHECLTSTRFKNGKDVLTDDYQRIIYCLFKKVHWNATRYVKFNENKFHVMRDVVQHLCKKDPTTTTIAEMDELDPVIECLIDCNHLTEYESGRAMMTWSSVPVHGASYYHYDRGKGTNARSTMAIVNDEAEAKLARARMQEELERIQAKADFKGMICVHCRRTGNASDLAIHVRKDHNILQPSKEDVIPLLNSDTTPPQFLLWPPRDWPSSTSATL